MIWFQYIFQQRCNVLYPSTLTFRFFLFFSIFSSKPESCKCYEMKSYIRPVDLKDTYSPTIPCLRLSWRLLLLSVPLQCHCPRFCIPPIACLTYKLLASKRYFSAQNFTYLFSLRQHARVQYLFRRLSIQPDLSDLLWRYDRLGGYNRPGSVVKYSL